MRTLIATLGVCIGLGGICPQPGLADEWDKKTVFTFSGPVEIPGKVLPAGTYVFKLMDSPSDRNIVMIYDKDERQLIGTVLAVPDERLEPKGKTVVSFEERPSGSPEALRGWFYPGDTKGEHFVYPYSRAKALAQTNHQRVLSTRGDDTSATGMKKAHVRAVQPTGEEVDLNQSH